MQVERISSDALVVNKLPDGSTIIVDAKNETVFALNATAAAAWDACSDPTTLSQITQQMQGSLNSKITEQFAEEAVLQLREKNLVRTLGRQPNRRQFIAALGVIAALPVVTSLPVTEQRAYAQHAKSAPPSGNGGSGGGRSLLDWLLHLLGLK
ncbi:PqqD family peptide modification chaperone [Alloacidobacterium sp.]|uniref:PqqD family peptide modification chaperone n=1 Tax=Alloacidobacterium sp. TaxID=2951999 RepID=UPI002D715BEA|nr:PqqD family peptide modification chaperone [Alloacidobacterium sp.]HYK34971.1 PqqD family peptide modification chaperone [Alloacidobacterium sp.]